MRDRIGKVGRYETTSGCYLTVVMPAYNEEKNITQAITDVLQALDEFGVFGELIVVDDGSVDSTRELIHCYNKRDVRIRLISLEHNMGIGKAFWTGVDQANGQVITMLPGDNENDPKEIIRYCSLLDHVDIVVPFVFNKESRSLFRNMLSVVYRFIVNTTFLVHFNYTNGTILYRKSVLESLGARQDGFFFQTDILIRLVKAGFLFAEVPYQLSIRRSGTARAVSFPSLFQVVKGYLGLVRDLYDIRNRSAPAYVASSSATATRRKGAS